MRLGVGDAVVEQPGVQLLVALEPQPRREEALAHQADLVLDLALLPARRRRAGDRLDQVVAAHLQEAAIVVPLLADEDRLHRRLHVVVDAARAGALEEGEGPVVGVEHHLLGLARIGPHEQHPAVAEPDVGDLHGHRHAVHQHDLVAPVELVGLARRKAQRHIGRRRRLPRAPCPAPGVAPHRVVAAVVASARAAPRRSGSASAARAPASPRSPASSRSSSAVHGPSFGRGWTSRSYANAVSPDRSTLRTVFRDTFSSRAISLIVLPLTKMLAPDPRNRLHAQHPPPPASNQSGQRIRPIRRGSILDADPPAQGVKIARRNTVVKTSRTQDSAARS